MLVGLIMAAGKQRRFNSCTPKSLCTYDNKTLAEHNIEILSEICDKVYMVISDDYVNIFNNSLIKPDNILNIGLSGLGSGDAVLKAIIKLNLWKEDNVIICWGDTILDRKVVLEVNSYYSLTDKVNKKVLIPAVWEDNPYVKLNGKDVKFSKYNDIIDSGYHDLSVFIGNAYDIVSWCSIFVVKFYDYDEHIYKHKHGNEFEFLDIFNDSGAEYMIYHVLNYKDKSFNTVEEYKNICKT